MRFIGIPLISKLFYPSIIKSFPLEKGKLFFSFDDGPNPDVTPQILEILEQHNAKATFFCLGQNAEKHPELLNKIIAKGHSIGNHSYSHLNGFRTPNDIYIHDVEKAEQLIPSNLFRPPYGKITPRQYHFLKKKYKIILWDVLAYDFDQTLSANQCVDIVLNHVKNGSIVVFHDSNKAKNNILAALPKLLDELSKRNFVFEKIR
jgi:peptidoglycan/xylan/chitin deacetylase (PgdA/CDA1 family)